jgi:hypothetical protein
VIGQNSVSMCVVVSDGHHPSIISTLKNEASFSGTSFLLHFHTAQYPEDYTANMIHCLIVIELYVSVLLINDNTFHNQKLNKGKLMFP